MPLFKEWDTHFQSLPIKTLAKLETAFGTLLADPMINENYHADFRDLFYLVTSALLDKRNKKTHTS